MPKQSRATAIANDIQFPLFLSAIKRLKLAAKFPKIVRKTQNSKIISSTLSSGYPISLFTSSTFMIFVLPGVSSGTPATTTTLSPSLTISIRFAQSIAC